MSLKLRIIIFIIGLIGLVSIRYFENVLFYDPLINFYNSNFQNSSFPDLNVWIYSLNLGFRFMLNSVLSLVLIWVTFKNKSFIKFSTLLYCILFIGGLVLFWGFTIDIQPKNYMILFYIRRFLIHPILVIILIPAFYFQKLNKK